MNLENVIVFAIVLFAVLYLARRVVLGKGCGCHSDSAGSCCSTQPESSCGCDDGGDCCGEHKN